MQSDEKTNKETEASTSQPETMRYRLLVIEDEVEVSRLIGYTLENSGYELKVVNDGMAGLDAFDTYQPHLVLLDLTMPGMSGQEVYAALRRKSDVPVIVVSALVGDASIPVPEDAVAQISKPFNPKNLARQVQEQLSRHYEPS